MYDPLNFFSVLEGLVVRLVLAVLVMTGRQGDCA